MALKVGPEMPFQNLVVEKPPGAILTLHLAGCISELISKVFKLKKNLKYCQGTQRLASYSNSAIISQ